MTSIAVVAFCCGFVAVALLRARRDADIACGDALLAQAVDDFTAPYEFLRPDVEHLTISRERLNRLRHALEVRDVLRA